MSAQVRPTSSAQDSGPIKESTSFAAHLKTIERKIPLRARYENFIGGKWVAPVKGAYFDNISPTTGQVVCKIARSQAEDVELAESDSARRLHHCSMRRCHRTLLSFLVVSLLAMLIACAG